MNKNELLRWLKSEKEAALIAFRNTFEINRKEKKEQIYKACGADVLIKNLKEFTYKEEGREDKKLYLTYYVCPKCGKKYFVQIDDEMSLKAFKTIAKNFVKLARLKQSGRVTRKQQLKFNKQRRNLEAYRNKLKTYYVGKTVYDKRTDENFILVLSI